MPSILALALRLVGALLGGYLLWVALRRVPAPTSGWRLGWPGAVAIAIVAFVAGWLAADSVGTALAVGAAGPTVEGEAAVGAALAAGSPVARAAVGAAFALTALVAAPVLVARDVLRTGLGLLLLIAAAGLVGNGLSLEAEPAAELGLAVLTATGGAAVAALSAGSLRQYGDLVLREPNGRAQPIRHRPLDDAHEIGLGTDRRR